jgi:hypothetical protein
MIVQLEERRAEGLAGYKIPGENYYVAKIEMGQAGTEQPKPVRTF